MSVAGLGIYLLAALTGGIGGIVGAVGKDFIAPWLLDRLRAKRDRASEIEREERAVERENKPLRTRIIERVQTLLREFQRYYSTETFTLEEWERLQDEIRSLVYSNEGARALDVNYATMMDAIRYNTIAIQRRHQIEFADPALPPLSAIEFTNLEFEKGALTTLRISDAGSKFIAALDALGAGGDAEFGDGMRLAIKQANEILDALYPELA